MCQHRMAHWKLSTVNRLSPCACSVCEITALQHEIGNDSMEFAAFICQLLSPLAHALFPCAESSEILCSLGDDIPVQTKCDAAYAARDRSQRWTNSMGAARHSA